MNKAIMTVAAFALAVLILACGVKNQAALRDSVDGYFTARVKNDISGMYKYINPKSRELISEESFRTQQKRYVNMKLNDFSIVNITFADSTHATVDVLFTLDSGVFSTQFPFIYEEGGWYRRYPTYETDKRK